MKWDSTSLWLKAKVFADRSNRVEHEDPSFGFWSAMALELLARAALSSVHPTLNADPREVDNILYALEQKVSKQPRSLPAHAVYLRLERLVEGFGRRERELCEYLSLLRNEELHTGALPFDTLRQVTWIGRYYSVRKTLCEFMGKTLTDYLGDETAATAEQLIHATNEGVKKTVLDRVAGRRRAFQELSEQEQQEHRALAAIVGKASMAEGWTSSACPACASEGVLTGAVIREFDPEYVDGELVVKQELLASTFRCLACDLELASLGEIVQASMEPHFVQVQATSLHEMFEEDLLNGYMNM